MSTLFENIEALSSTVKDLKTFLVNKGLVDSDASLTQFKNEISATNVAINQNVYIPLGAVQDIRFSIIDNILNICWEDPSNIIQDETIVARFGSTVLRAKLDEYPTNHNDGIELYSGTTRNVHLQSPLTIDLDSLGLVSEGHTIYFRFFSSTASTDFWNDDSQAGNANRFTSDNYDWTMIYSALKDYPNSRNLSVLPEPASQIYVNYIVNDYYLNGTTKVACETRQSVIDNEDKLSTVSIPFWVLGYNANVPQYIPYRRIDNQSGEYEYMYVQVVDDSVSVVNAFNSNGDANGQLSITVGNMQFRNIEAGCRVYSEDQWNIYTSKKSYTYTGNNVQAISESTFPYNNEGTGTQYVYNAPTAISVDGKQYDFCGYTMTLQPVNALIGVTTGATNSSGIQFDAAENTYATPYETFPSDYHQDRHFYTLSNDGLHEVDWTSDASKNFNEITDDIYEVVDDQLQLKTAYYERYHKYNRLIVDGTTNTYQKLVEIFDFTPGEIYYPNCEPKNYDATYNMSVYADIVRYNGTLYLCKAQVPEGNTTTPDQLTACFRTLTSDNELSIQTMYDNGDYFVSGTKIPVTNGGGTIVEVNIKDRNSYGCNLYEESFYKQYCNNINGSRTSSDSPYKKMNKFDNISTSANSLANSNSLMLKLYKQKDLIRYICPTANRTVLSLKNYQYRKNWQFIGSGNAYNSGRWETSLDLFWPLAYYETFGSGADASSTFSAVYPNNTARIKKAMTATGADGSAVTWWLRNPNTGDTHYENYVITSGAAPSNIANTTNGFSPAFIIC